MRRKDREIKDDFRIKKILDSAQFMSLALCDKDVPYVITLNYSYENKEGQYFFYFHSALNGRKIDYIKNNKKCSISIVSSSSLKKDDLACSWSNYYESVVAEGIINEIKSIEDKELILKNFMKRHGYPGEASFTKTALESVCVFKINCSSLSCKIHEK